MTVPSLVLALVASLAQAAPPAAAEPGDPAAAVRQLLDGWRAGDFERASTVLAPEFRLLTLRRGETGPHLDIDTRDHLLAGMRQLRAGAWDVRLGEMQMRRDESGIATIWAPYTFYINGRKSHCGIETYILYRLASGWRIAEFADTHLWDGQDAQCPDRAPA